MLRNVGRSFWTSLVFTAIIVIGFSLLLVACSSSLPPTSTVAPTEAPSLTTATPAPSATSTPQAEVAALTIETSTDIAYAHFDDETTHLDVYGPREAGPWPVVIVVHGGLQNKDTFANLADTIASHGTVVYNIDVILTLDLPFTSSIEGIACAVRFARATAADYDGDPTRIILVGNSAGASGGAVVAMAGDDFAGNCIATDGSALVNGFVGYEGPYDIATTVYGPVDHTVLKDEDPEQWRAINPYTHIGRNPELQLRLVHGNDADAEWYDTPLEVSREFYQALADAGYDVELTVVEGDPHTALTMPSSDAFASTVELVMELARSVSK